VIALFSKANAQAESKMSAALDVVARDKAKIQSLHDQLMKASRLAGMSEVTVGVLHNVGNVLNSANISVGQIRDRVKKMKIDSVGKSAELLKGDSPPPEKLKSLGEYLQQVGVSLLSDRQTLVEETGELDKSIDHLKRIIELQQQASHPVTVIESFDIRSVVEDALKMSETSFLRHGVRIEREYEEIEAIQSEKHRVMQILINLIGNARHAVKGDHTKSDKVIRLQIKRTGDDRVQIVVTDNGVGILPEHMSKIFTYGFSTKKSGHGFGLHSSALAVKELGGTIRCESQGPGRGATFIFELPFKPAVESRLAA
jgi:signal transduction histidine kinase